MVAVARPRTVLLECALCVSEVARRAWLRGVEWLYSHLHAQRHLRVRAPSIFTSARVSAFSLPFPSTLSTLPSSDIDSTLLYHLRFYSAKGTAG